MKTFNLFQFNSCKVYDVEVLTNDDANFLKSLEALAGYDFWSMTRLLGSKTTVMVAPEHQTWFENSLEKRNIEFKVTIEDLEK